MSVRIARKSGGLLLVLVLFILTISSVYGYTYGVACNKACSPIGHGSCGISDETTGSWTTFGSLSSYPNCIYTSCTSACSSCDYGDCAPGYCVNSASVATGNSIVTKVTGCPGETWKACSGDECVAVSCIGATATYKFSCDAKGGITLIPGKSFFGTQGGAADASSTCPAVGLESYASLLSSTAPKYGSFSYVLDGTAVLTARSESTQYSIDTTSLSASGKRLVTDLKLVPYNFNFGAPCALVSYNFGSSTPLSLDCLYAPSSNAGCCAYYAPDFKLNTNKIVKATSGIEKGRWYFCADTTLDKQTLTGFTSAAYWRESGKSRYRFDRIDFTKSTKTVPAIFRGTNGTFFDVLATDYVGDSAYGWLICKSDGFYSSSGTILAPASNILQSISSTLPQQTVDDVLGGGSNGALVGTPGSDTMSLKDFLKMLGGVAVASPSSLPNTQTPDVFYSSSSYSTEQTYYTEEAYSNEKTIDRLQGSIVFDPTDMKLRKDSSNKIISNEPLLYGRKFPADKVYYDISIRDSITRTEYNSRDHISFRKDASGSRFNIDALPDKAFVVQNDNALTATIDESGYLKPVYIVFNEFNNENNKGKSYDVILHFCSSKNSIVSGVYGADCTTYEYKNLLRLGFVVDDKTTLASSAFFCRDNKIYECCGRNFYCMNKEMLGKSSAENLANLFVDNDPKFKSLRRSSQFVDVVYDPDFEVINVSQRDNEVKIYTDVALNFAMSNPSFLFKKEIDGNKFTNLEFDFFTYFPLDGKIRVCLNSGKACCVDVSQTITQRVFEHISLPLTSFSCYDTTNNKLTISSLQVSAVKKSSTKYITNCVIEPDKECDNLFVLDRFFVSKSSDPSYFCGSNRTWIRDFDLDPIACDDTPGMYWAGGLQGSAGSNGLVANNKNCCGDDPGETWENPNGNGACVNGRYIFNNQRYMDSFRLTEAEVTPAKNIDYAQVLAYDGKLYGCNINGITVGTKVFTVDSASGDTLDGALVTATKISSPGTSEVAFKGTDFNLKTPVLYKDVLQCSVKGSFYCSPRDGWRKDVAKDFISAGVFGNERIGYSNISADIGGSTKDKIYLLDASENQLKSISERTGELDGCCPVGWCWNGFSCTQNQRDRPSDWLRLVKDHDGDRTITDADLFFRCIDGRWTSTPPTKKTWQSKETLLIPGENIRELNYNPSGVSGTTNGFCPRTTDCLVNPSVPSNRYNRSFDYLGNSRCDVVTKQADTLCIITNSANVKVTGYLNKGNCTISGGLRLPSEVYSTGVCTVTKGDGSKVTGVIGISSQSARGQDYLNDYLKTVMTNAGTRLYEDIELYKFPNIQDIQCLPSGYYIGDYFCGKDDAGNGRWTSRTEIMFEQLSNFTKVKGINDKFTIHCGNFEEVFNTRPEFSSPAEYNNKGCVLRGNCTGGYCPADHDGKAGFSILALELNSKNPAILTSMKASRDIRRPYSQNWYDQVNSNPGMFSHYPDANIIFISKDIALPNELGKLDIFGFFQRILNFFRGFVPNTNDFRPSAYLDSYYVVDKLYFAKSGSKIIFASSGYSADSEIMTKIVYSGFTDEEITDIKNQFEKFVSYETSRESNWVGAVDYLRDPVVSDNGNELLIEFSLPDSYLLSNVFYEDLSKSSKGDYPTNLFWDRLMDDFVVQTRLN